jgi:FlaA1/EpsC-like NDP-sugar epimerase
MSINSFIKMLIHAYALNRVLFFLISDIILFIFSLFLSFLFHFDLNLNIDYVSLIAEVAPLFIAIKIIALGIFSIYSISWRYVGIKDLINIIISLIFSELILILLSLPSSFINYSLPILGFPKRIFFVDGIISLCLIGGLRISKRIYLEVIRKKKYTKEGKKTIIIGAGNTGEMILRDMVRQNYSGFRPIGFLDDNRTKLGTIIHGVRVIDTVNALSNVIQQNAIEAVIIAIPSLNHRVLRDMYNTCVKMNIRSIKIVPRIYDYDKPDINLKALEDISIEDLIGRQSIIVDYRAIRDFIGGRLILVTGAGGSIGAEIITQICTFQPNDIVLFDIDETELHNLGLKLNRLFPHLSGQIHYVTGDVRDKIRLKEVFDSYRPQIVFHAAAYKHVPMMEYNPKEAVKVNIFGTYNLAKTAMEYAVEKFIMISTDKAVRPTSIMGATKRVAEHVCKAFNNSSWLMAHGSWQNQSEDNRLMAHGSWQDKTINQQVPISYELSAMSHNKPSAMNYEPSAISHEQSATKFISVRFGNVLGSRGSVLPLFLDQLKHGGPLTVTHKDMKRYFMTIPEAVSLVLQASTMGEGGEVFVLDMGEPVNITDVAEELIRIHGLEPYKDIDIEFTGLRPGEKLFEEILTAEEGTVSSKHEKVFVARNSEKYSLDEIEDILKEFRELIAEPSIGNDGKVRELLKKYVKHYEEQ